MRFLAVKANMVLVVKKSAVVNTIRLVTQLMESAHVLLVTLVLPARRAARRENTEQIALWTVTVLEIPPVILFLVAVSAQKEDTVLNVYMNALKDSMVSNVGLDANVKMAPLAIKETDVAFANQGILAIIVKDLARIIRMDKIAN